MTAFGCPIPQLNINCCSGTGTAGGVSYGLSSHSGNGLYVKRFSLNIALITENDHFIFERWCSHLIIKSDIMAVQICMRNAFSLVPMNVFTFSVCFSVLKKSSISHRSLYIAPMVDAASLKLLVSIFISSCFSSFQTVTRRSFLGVFDFGVYACKNDLIIRAYVAAVCPQPWMTVL